MALINPLLGSNLASTGFDSTLIGNSVWLDGSADFLSVELGAKTRTKAVIGTWIQKTGFSTSDATFFSKKGSAQFAIRMQDQSSKKGKISIFDYDGSANQYDAESTTMLLRDIGWYHIMISIDTTASAGSRLKYYINGIDQTSTLTVATDYTLNDNPSITGGSGEPTQWGVGYSGTSQFIPCYLAQSFMLDDDSIQNGDVAVTDILDGFTFGTNGSQYTPKADADIAALASSAGGDSFCLDYANSSDLGNDISSNNNDFTPTSMAAANQSSNTPSLVYPTINALTFIGSASSTLAEGNTKATVNDNGGIVLTQTLPFSGLYYWEINVTTNSAWYPGIGQQSAIGYNSTGAWNNTTAETHVWLSDHSGNLFNNNGTNSTYPVASPTTGRFAVAWDGDNRALYFGQISGSTITWTNSGNPTSGSSKTGAAPGNWPATGSAPLYFIVIGGGTSVMEFDFPSGDWTGSTNRPADAKELNSANLTAPEKFGVDHFQPVLYAGNGSARSISTDIDPAWVWIKNRGTTDEHKLVDAVRGATKELSSDSTAVESTDSNGVTAFGTGSFSLGSGANGYNDNTENFVAWVWEAGTAFSNDASATGIGTIDSSGRVSASGAFSIATYTGNTSAGATFKHGLSIKPELILFKRFGATTANWMVHHVDAGVSNTDWLMLDTTGAKGYLGAINFLNATAPNTSIITLGDDSNNNAADTYVTYNFASVAGVCKVGSYEGNNNANGTLINLGFTPAFFMSKNIDATGSWFVLDSARGFNSYLQAEDAVAGTTGTVADRLADGMKWRTTGGGNAANTFIYLAIADIGGNGTLPPIYGR